MLAQKMLVDRPAAPKSVLGFVPESDASLAQFPAQTNLAILIQAQEIDQADIQILDQRAGPLDLAERLLERRRAGVAPGANREPGAAVHLRSAGGANTRDIAVELPV